MSSGGKLPSSRRTVCCRRHSAPTMPRNGFGRRLRDRGPNRVPRPPAMITANLRGRFRVRRISDLHHRERIPTCRDPGTGHPMEGPDLEELDP